MKNLAYFGPDGTFCSEAARLFRGSRDFQLEDFETIPDVVNAVLSGKAEVGVVPLENSIEGSVNVTVDMFVENDALRIQQEIDLPVEHFLMVPIGVKFEDITEVLSHPQALAQCRNFLQKNLPKIPTLPAKSTADAARRVAHAPERGFDGQVHRPAAIGNQLAAQLYGLEVLKKSIQDHDANVTRFVVLGHDEPDATGHDRTSIVFASHRDRPGSLFEVLGEFAQRQINLSKIESRPSKKVLGDYYFWVDLEGHRSDAKVAEALESLKAKVGYFRLLGSYPKHL